MSGNRNEELSFQVGLRRPTISRYYDYRDTNQNLWQIEVAGLPDAVRQFTRKRELLVSAKSLSAQEVTERQAEAEKRLAEIDRQRAAAEPLHITPPQTRVGTPVR